MFPDYREVLVLAHNVGARSAVVYARLGPQARTKQCVLGVQHASSKQSRVSRFGSASVRPFAG